MRLRRQVLVAALLLALPAAVLIALGVLVLVYQRGNVDLAFGVLILVFCALLIAGGVSLGIALKRSSDLSRLQADFLSKVSHDFRTPLTSIRMFVETLREHRLEDPQRRERVLTLLGQETERLSTMIDRLLDFARLEAGRMSYDLQWMDLTPVIAATVARFEPRLIAGPAGQGPEAPRTELLLHIDPGLPRVHADADAIAEVLQNLIDNALKYTGAVKRVEVSARVVHARQGDQLHIAVRDNGPGVPRREQSRIFEAFYRVDDRLARSTEGSGLGLAISQHIAAAHGGRVRLESERGQGACFTLELPVEQRLATPPAGAVP